MVDNVSLLNCRKCYIRSRAHSVDDMQRSPRWVNNTSGMTIPGTTRRWCRKYSFFSHFLSQGMFPCNIPHEIWSKKLCYPIIETAWSIIMIIDSVQACDRHTAWHTLRSYCALYSCAMLPCIKTNGPSDLYFLELIQQNLIRCSFAWRFYMIAMIAADGSRRSSTLARWKSVKDKRNELLCQFSLKCNSDCNIV